MEASKSFIVRSHVLGLLESGALTEGQQIPPARELATKLNVSFVKTQQSIDALCRDGVLEAQPRQGVYVLPGWQDRILQDNLSVFDSLHRLPWFPGLLHLLHSEIPDLRITKHFSRSILEVKTTLHIMERHEEYMDLSAFIQDSYPEKSIFFEKIFEPFRINGRLVGIPFSFSPRVIYCNPMLFAKAGCELPVHGWSDETFLTSLAKFKKILPPEQIINWHSYPFLWINFIFRAGGQLFNPKHPDPVCIDHPATLAGLHFFRKIGQALGSRNPYDDDAFRNHFLQGGAAMFLSDRLFTNVMDLAGFEDWIALPLPTLPGGRDVTAQATDVICVRNSCSSFSLVHKFVQLILSEQVQDYLASERVGIPIRKSSAFKGFDQVDPRESILLSETTKIHNEFHLASPYPGELVLKGIQRLLLEDLDLEQGCKELADLARTTLGIQKQLSGDSGIKSVFTLPAT